jgi:ribose 5-phosphate isomerase B
MENHSIVLGCDNAAVDFKNAIIAFLKTKGFDIEDAGIADSSDGTVYALVAEKVANIVLATPGKRGILFCGMGIGMAISANKVPGIRAACIHDAFSAERAALSNDANIVTMGSRIIGIELAKKLLLEWLSLHYKDGPSTSKIEAIHEVEQRCAGKAGASGKPADKKKK